MFALHRFAGRERQRTHGPAVEPAIERDEFLALRVVSRELHGRFDRFRAGIAEIDALRFLARRIEASFSASSTMPRNRNPCRTCASVRRPASEWRRPLRDGNAPWKRRRSLRRNRGKCCRLRLRPARRGPFSRPADSRACRTAKRLCGRARQSLGFGPGQRRDEMRQLHFCDWHCCLLRQNSIFRSARADRCAARAASSIRGEDLVYAEEVRALVGGLAMQANAEFVGDLICISSGRCRPLYLRGYTRIGADAGGFRPSA